MHTIEKGDISVAMITAAFLRRRYTVLKPLSENCRYDLVIDRGSGFERIQCKTGRMKGGTIRFSTASSTMHHRNGKIRDYRGQADWFAVYCPATEACYMVKVGEVGLREGCLRIEETKNKQSAGIRLAASFKL